MLQLQVEAVEHEDPQKAVDEQIEVMRREKSKTTIVQGRGLQDGDLAVVTFEAQNPQTNEPMPNTQHQRMQIDTNIPTQIPLPGEASPECVCRLHCWETHRHAG